MKEEMKEMPEHEVPFPVIRKVIEEYFPFDTEENNPMFRQYVKSWNRLVKDIQDNNADKKRMSFYAILDHASRQAFILRERCNAAHYYIEIETCNFVNELRHFSKNVAKERRHIVTGLAEVWEGALNNSEYLAATLSSNIIYLDHDFRDVMIEHEYGNLDTLIISRCKLIELKIGDLAKLYATYLGMNNAVRHGQINGEIVEYSEHLETVTSQNKKDFDWLPPIYRTIKYLLIYGHPVNTAIKIRFLSLNHNDRYTYQQCYDIISEELNDLGFSPENKLPTEAKALADRARRYTENRLEELNKITRNHSRQARRD